MKAREERIAKTESLFRSVNERIAEATDPLIQDFILGRSHDQAE